MNQADLRAAVFLKAQGLPVTPAAVQIVRQAWLSGSALGQEVEQLRDALADLGARLAGMSSEPEMSAGETAPLPRSATVLEPEALPRLQAAPTTSGQAGAEESPTGRPTAVHPEGGAPFGEPPTVATALVGGAPTRTEAPQIPVDVEGPAGTATPLSSSSAPAEANGLLPTAAAPPPSVGPGEPPPIGRLLAAVSESLAHLQLVDDAAVDGSRHELTARIRQVVAEQGTPVEAKLARVLEGLADGPAHLDKALVADLRTALSDLVDQARRHLDDRTGVARLSQEAIRDLESVRSHAESILGRVELQQMTNASAATTPGDTNYLMFQLPVPGGRDGQTAQIRIRQDEGGGAKRIDPKNVHVVFQFEMQNLSTVRVSLRVVDRRVTCQMGSTDPAATALLDHHAGRLRDGLSEIGYQVDELRCATLTPDDLRAPDPTVDAPTTRSRCASTREPE